jgi:flavodoxin
VARILVVYYSRTGTTRLVAEQVANALGADIEEVSDRANRMGRLGYFRSLFEGTFRRRSEIGPPVHELETYDLVLLGSPVWTGSVSSPVRSFIRRHRDRMKAVGFFCTCGGWRGEQAVEQMARESSKHPVARLVLRNAEVSRGAAGPKVRDYVERIRQAEREEAFGREARGEHHVVDVGVLDPSGRSAMGGT